MIETLKEATDKAWEIISEAQDCKQTWMNDYGGLKMVIVPMEVLNYLYIAAMEQQKKVSQ